MGANGTPGYRIFTPYIKITALVISLLVGFMIVRAVANRIDRALTDDLVETSRVAYRQITQELGIHDVALNTLTSDQILQQAILEGDTTRLKGRLILAIETYDLDTIMLFDESGELLFYADVQQSDSDSHTTIIVSHNEPAQFSIVSGQIAQPGLVGEERQAALLSTSTGLTAATSENFSIGQGLDNQPAWLGTLVVGRSVDVMIDELDLTHHLEFIVFGEEGTPLSGTLPGWQQSDAMKELSIPISLYNRIGSATDDHLVLVNNIYTVTLRNTIYRVVYTPLPVKDKAAGIIGLYLRSESFLPITLLISDSLLVVVFALALLVQIVGGVIVSARIIQPVFNTLEEENARSGAILRSIADGIVLRSPDGRITLANPAAVGLLSTSDHLQPEAIDNLTSSQSRQPYSRRINVGERTVDVSVAAIHTDDGEFIGDVLVLRDITRDAIVERTKDNFLDQIGHELRTPLTVIRGYVDVMRLGGEQLKPGVRDRAMEAILNETQTLARMIDEIIELTGLVSSGKQAMRMKLLVINHLIADVIDAWDAQLAESKLLIEHVNSCQDLIVEGDSKRLRRAFDALIQNAINYSPHGGLLNITLAPQGPYIVLTIKDSGVGISEVDLPNIFDRFYRGEPVDLAGQMIDVRGTGQGLYAVKTIIEAHGGTIEATSAPGDGTTFTIRLPLTVQPETTPSQTLSV